MKLRISEDVGRGSIVIGIDLKEYRRIDLSIEVLNRKGDGWNWEGNYLSEGNGRGWRVSLWG